MQLKTIVLFVLAFCFCSASFAQDKIYKRDGEVIQAKIKSIGIKTVTYTRFDNQSGPEYTIVKNLVERIVYQNGVEDVFDEKAPRAAHHRGGDNANDEPENKIKYKLNVLSIAPIQFSENGLGVGLSYERALDKKGIISFYFPVAVTFDLNNGTYYNYAAGAYQNGHQDMMSYFMPGIKIYPTGSFGTVRYSVGPSLVIATGQKSTTTYDPYSGSPSDYVTQDHLMLGMIINNTLNVNPSPHIYLGLELGLGFSYLNQVAGLNQGTQSIIQGGFKIGYRF